MVDYTKLDEERKICCNCKHFYKFSCLKGLKTACDSVIDCQDCLEQFWCLLKPYCVHFEPKIKLLGGGK